LPRNSLQREHGDFVINTLKKQGKTLEVMMKGSLVEKNIVVYVDSDIFKIIEYFCHVTLEYI
jgi:hypothetical protein